MLNCYKNRESVSYNVSPGFAVSCCIKNGILLLKLFRPTVRKKCSIDQAKVLKFEAKGREFAKFLRSLEQFIQTVKGQNKIQSIFDLIRLDNGMMI